MANSKQCRRSGNSVARRIYHRIPTHHVDTMTFDGEFERRIIDAGGHWRDDGMLILRGDAVAYQCRGFLWIKEADPEAFKYVHCEQVEEEPMPLWAGNVG